jgi:hypothetical protein
MTWWECPPPNSVPGVLQADHILMQCGRLNEGVLGREKLCPGKTLSGRNSDGINSVPILILPGKNSVPSIWDGENI